MPRHLRMERDWQDLSGSRVVVGENTLLGLMIDRVTNCPLFLKEGI